MSVLSMWLACSPRRYAALLAPVFLLVDEYVPVRFGLYVSVSS